VLAAGVAHEINNPMTFVTSNVQALAQDLDELAGDPELRREYVQDVLPATLDGIRRVNTIVGDILRFARKDPGVREPYDLVQQIETAVRMSRSYIKHFQVDVETCALPRMYGKPQQIVQALVNLIVNAAQASDAAGRIVIATALDGDEVVLRVTDFGTGMSPEVRARLFEPFFTTKPVGAGTGLGLAVVHGVVTSHAGSISVDSTPGAGSTFTIRLPAQSAATNAAA
jgi:two-component system NtrC family sensor kinase